MKMMNIKEDIGTFIATGLLGLLMTHAVNERSEQPTGIEEENKTIIQYEGVFSYYWGEDTDKDGTLDACYCLLQGPRGGGVIRIDEERTIVTILQKDYDLWNSERQEK
jgi:hypothetical protein